ncbi:DUF3168 domain-containing protein [uncultured Sphingomonas sp.]|uniref:tail completion protein gp17 n=1 Tax=uncultured Sphingomonas sp. TaxID=158754 RepID=UPI0025CE4450|nr:DUF3168 domain-containing protein [uncultured Sphingomonas sp.]
MTMEETVAVALSTLTSEVYPGHAPLDYQVPVVIYNRLSTTPADDLDDDSQTGFASFQIDVYDHSLSGAMTMAGSVRQVVRSISDDVVQSVTFTDQANMLDQTTATTLYRVKMDFSLFGIV